MSLSLSPLSSPPPRVCVCAHTCMCQPLSFSLSFSLSLCLLYICACHVKVCLCICVSVSLYIKSLPSELLVVSKWTSSTNLWPCWHAVELQQNVLMSRIFSAFSPGTHFPEVLEPAEILADYITVWRQCSKERKRKEGKVWDTKPNICQGPRASYRIYSALKVFGSIWLQRLHCSNKPHRLPFIGTAKCYSLLRLPVPYRCVVGSEGWDRETWHGNDIFTLRDQGGCSIHVYSQGKTGWEGKV